MQPTTTAISTTPRMAPIYRDESDDVLVEFVRARQDAAEWRMVRKGLRLMAWCLTVFLICVLAIIVLLPARSSLVCLPILGLPVTGTGYMIGVLLSLGAPGRARLTGWIATYLVCLIGGIFLLVVALFWREMGWKLSAVFGKRTTRIVAQAGVGEVLVGLLGYCLYLAAIARRFGTRRLARCFVAFFVALAVPVVLIAVTENASLYFGQSWISSSVRRWEQGVELCASGMLFALGVTWVALLWRLLWYLPCEDPRCGLV